MPFDLLAQYLNGQNAGASPMAPQGPGVTPTPMPTPSPIPGGVPEVYPSGTPGALASNEAIGNPYASGLMGGGPPPPAMKPRSMAAPQSQSLHVDEPAPESTPVDPGPDELDQYKVTPEDLQDASRQRMAAKMISGLGNIFANQQSAGNYYLHQMAPKTDVTDFSDLAGQGVRDKQALYKQAYDSRANKQKLQEGDQKTQAAQMQMAQAKSFEDPNSTDSKYGKVLLMKMNTDHQLGLKNEDISSMNARQVGQFLGSPGVADIVAGDKQAKQYAQQMALEDKKLQAASAKADVKQSNTDNKDWEGLSNRVNDPSVRNQIGKFEQNIQKAGALKAFERGIGMPPGQTAPDNETQAQKIARYNRASPQDIYEMAKASDQLISNASSTAYGTEHLMPKDWGMQAANLSQWAKGGPAPANSGEFLDKYFHTADRENKYYQQAKDQAVEKLASGYSHLKAKDANKWNNVLGINPSGVPAQSSGGSGFTPDVIDYAKKHNLTNEQALQLKLKRTAVAQGDK